MHTVQACSTEISGEKEHGGNAILTTNRKLMQAAHCSSLLQFVFYLKGPGQSGRLVTLLVAGYEHIPTLFLLFG